ncbi:hypothetical protein [Wolbachia endosymbiont of Folsomia candida]|uniref:hypothetical protein n=1 Tax=Wolbachia endosymbiont of Folsomia candida TaxID=169402 RepID=UPI000A874F1D|nr:hypothetical protein [Wolbachia endosymbiont of Folsomia candida]APR99064.1 hypothetical protein ASM33_07750 [Wolbachia endosymbiont of Folsomia candida]
MKVKRLFTLAALLTSSLAGAIDLENKYYAGLNFGGQYSFRSGGSLSYRPNVLIGYHYEKSSKLELEINGDVESLKHFTIGFLGNYRYYPDFKIDPVTLYVSAGLGAGYTKGGVSSTSVTGDGGTTATKEEPAKVTVPVVYAGETVADGTSMIDKVLGYFFYKLKVGVDYEFTPQIVGAVGINVGGSVHSLIKLNPGTGIELGIRYNF